MPNNTPTPMSHSERQLTEVTLPLFVPKIVRARCKITYEVNAMGSERLYRLKTVETMQGEPLDPVQVERLNPALDKHIAAIIHSGYAEENDLNMNPRKKCKKKLDQPDHPTLPL